MNKSDILTIARQQLFDAISSFQAPTCDPLTVTDAEAAFATSTEGFDAEKMVAEKL
jgi:hypothetical protein